MTKHDFRTLFVRALEAAAQNAEDRLGHRVPRSFLIELHAPGISGQTLSVDDALERIYLGHNRFYRQIDVGLRRLLSHEVVAFVRVSGHAPAAFSKTWDPIDLGPFHQILAERIEDLASSPS